MIARTGTAIEARRDVDGDTFAPNLLLSAERIADQLLAGEDVVDMLVRLAAHQDRRTSDAVTMRRWRCRLELWSRVSPCRDRFAVLIDRLNETSGKSWAMIILKLRPVVRDLGGEIIIVTCRCCSGCPASATSPSRIWNTGERV